MEGAAYRPRELSPALDDRWIDTLSPALREAVAIRWQERVRSELEVGLALSDLTERLMHAGASDAVVSMARESAAQERHHAAMCQELAERYGERTTPLPDLTTWAPISFGRPDAETELVFAVVGQTCVSETIATGWLRACLREIASPTARAAYALHLKEELGHARVGWAYLASTTLSAPAREALARSLKSMVDANVAAWEQEANFLPGDALPSHGFLSRARSISAIRHTVEKVIYPGFAYHGITLSR
jgi:hypothetical protein